MERTNCNLCGGSQFEIQWRGKDWVLGNPGMFSMVRCLDCGLLFLNPRPTQGEMKIYYPRDYEPYRRVMQAFKSDLRRLLYRFKLRSRVNLVLRQGSGGRLLDVGCAAGGFLWEMRNQGSWDVQGVEVDAASVEFARRKLDLDLYHGNLEGSYFPDDYFDVVTMWDVIEHLRDPFTTLVEIRRVLKPGGKLIISTPNADSWDAHLFGRYWIGLDFPRHLYVFSSKTLSRLLKRANLQPEKVFCFYGRYTTFALSLSICFNARVDSQSWQKLWRGLVLLPIFRYITLPYFWAVDKLKQGAIISVIAKKSVDSC